MISWEAEMKTILLVEDDPDVLSYLKDTITFFGYTVIAKPDAESALSAIRKGAALDLVVTDYTLPGMDGVTFLRRLRSLAPSVPVVVLSGNDSIESYLRSLNLNNFDYVFKPVRSTELRTIMKAALEKDIRSKSAIHAHEPSSADKTSE
jgi:two-component system response regulator AauR